MKVIFIKLSHIGCFSLLSSNEKPCFWHEIGYFSQQKKWKVKITIKSRNLLSKVKIFTDLRNQAQCSLQENDNTDKASISFNLNTLPWLCKPNLRFPNFPCVDSNGFYPTSDWVVQNC